MTTPRSLAGAQPRNVVTALSGPRWAPTAKYVASATLALLDAEPTTRPAKDLYLSVATAVIGYLAAGDRQGHDGQAEQHHGMTCAGDAQTLRAYLTSPPRATSGPTVAQRLGLDQTFRAGGSDIANRLYKLVNRAEASGVFGPDDHEIQTHQVHGGPDHTHGGYILTVQPPTGPQLCFGTFTETDLLGTNTSGVDAAVHALTVLAPRVTSLVHDLATHTTPSTASGDHLILAPPNDAQVKEPKAPPSSAPRAFGAPIAGRDAHTQAPATPAHHSRA